LSLAKKAGAFTIAITNYEKSPITKYADAVLLNSAEETPLRSGALTSKIAQLQVLDILYTAVALKMEDKAFKILDKTAEAVLSKLY
jgi:DNA-binding MurR/RpiR family transcriptional regulator